MTDPTLNYRTYETQHFSIHYPEGYLSRAIELGEVAENRHRWLEERYRSGVTDTSIVLIVGSDTVNAFASTYVLPRMALYVQSPAPGEFSNFHSWQDHLLIHEYTHVLNLYPYEGAANLLLRLVAGVPPNILSPLGIIEGFAVYEESAFGKGRLNDPLTDMVIRAAVQDNAFPSLEETFAGSHRWPRGRTPYLFGGRFIQYLRSRKLEGESATQRLDRYYLLEQLPITPAQRLERLGIADLQEAYDDFRRQEAEKAGRSMLAETPFRRLTDSGEGKRFLQLRGGRLFYFASLVQESGIFSLAVEEPADSGDAPTAMDSNRYREEYPGEQFANDREFIGLSDTGALSSVEKPEIRRHSLSWFRNPRASSGFTFLDDDEPANPPIGVQEMDDPDILSSEEAYADFSGFRFQLYRSSFPGLRSIDKGERIVNPSASGKRIVFIKREDPHRYLIAARLGRDGAIYDRRVLLHTNLDGILQYSTLSPDGRVALAVYRKGSAGFPSLVACSFPEAGQQADCRILASTRGTITQPSFSDRGVLFSSDRTGRFEVYRMPFPAGGWSALIRESAADVVVEQLSLTNTGLFYPVGLGDRLFAIRYFATGHDIVELTPSSKENVSNQFAAVDSIPEEPGERFLSYGASNGLPGDTVFDPVSYSGPFEVRPYFAGLLFGLSGAESGIVAFDPLERHEFSLGLGILEDTAYAGLTYRYNRYAHNLLLRYLRSAPDKRPFYCDAPRGLAVFLCLDYNYQFEFATVAVDRQLPGREVDQYYSFGIDHEKHRNAAGLVSPVLPFQDVNFSSLFASYAISNTTIFPLSISPERGFSLAGEVSFFPEQWVVLYDDNSNGIENAELYRLALDMELFFPFFLPNHVPYLALRGEWSSGKNPDVYRIRLSNYMRGIVPELSPSGRGAVTATAEYRFPLLWLSQRILHWWPSLALRYLALAPFYDYGQSFERQVFRDNWIRSYGLYLDVGLTAFYLPFAVRITYARGEGPSGETSFGFGLLIGYQPGNTSTDPFARSLMQRNQRFGNSRPGTFDHSH